MHDVAVSDTPVEPLWTRLSESARRAFIAGFVVCVAAFLGWALVIDGFAAGQAIVAELVIVLLAGVPALVLAGLCRRRSMIVACGAAWMVAIALVLTPWSPRKRFIRDLYSVTPGMTVDEVDAIMGGYIKGSGWAVPAGPPPVVQGRDEPPDEDAARRAAEAQAAYAPPAYPEGDDRARATGTMTYRWNDHDARYDADWGQVTFEGGRVVVVEFLPD